MKSAPEPWSLAPGSRAFWLGAPVIVVTLGVVSAAMLFAVFRVAERHLSEDVPLDVAVGEIRLRVGLSHLWLEEYLTGDPTVAVDRDVLEELERAEATVQSLLSGGRVDNLWTLGGPVASPEIEREIEVLAELLAGFRELTELRLSDVMNTGVGTPDDLRYDTEFRRVLDSTGELKKLVERRIRTSQQRGEMLFGGLLLLWVMVVALATINLIVGGVSTRKAEGRLRRSEARLVTTLASIGDAVITTDQWGRVVFMNRAAEALVGCDSEDCIGSHFSLVYRFKRIAGGEPLPEPTFQTVLKKGAPIVAVEQLLERRDGEEVPVEETAAPILDEAGRPSGVVVVVRNIADRKRSEEELRQRDVQLQHSQKMEAVGRLAGGLAHDINNYLGAITVECDVLRLLHEEDRGIRDRVEIIVDSVFKASSLIKRLLAFSRRQPTQTELVDLNAVIDGMESMCRRLIGEQVRLRTDLFSSLWTVRVDPSHVEQIVVNLLVNANEAMPGRGEIEIETRNLLLPTGLHAEDGDEAAAEEWVALRVSDTGCGIPEELRDRVFEPFFTTKESSGSSGLGLSTVYSIVDQAGGLIRIDSVEGKGTTFEVCLPRCNEPRAAVARARRTHRCPDRVTPRRVLFVEDNDDLRGATAAYLESLGHEVVATETGESALDLWQRARKPFEILVSDVLLPGMTGRELVDRLWEEGLRRVVLISGFVEKTEVEELLDRQGVAFLRKPFAGAALARAIEKLG